MRTVDWILAGFAAVFLAAALVASLTWRVELDTPIMLYQAFLMDKHGFVPYRDFFDMNMPGSYLAYFTIGKVFGYGDLGVRLADILLVLTMSGATGAMWWRLSRPGAVLAGSLVAIRYLGFGQFMTLQREFLLLVAVALGTAAAVSSLPLVRRSLLAGLAFGIAATVKPHAVFGLLPLVAYLAAEALAEPERPRQKLLHGLGAGTIGFALPLVVALGWMVASGVVGDFLHSLQYLKYYGSLSGEHQVVEAGDRPAHLLSGLLQLGHYPAQWVLAWAALGWAWCTADLAGGQRRMILLFAGMLGVFTLYPAASGQFWSYHWLPMNFWIAASLPAFLLGSPSSASAARRWAPRIVLLAAVLLLVRVYEGLDNRHFKQPAAPQSGRPDEIAAVLERHLHEGDTVQSVAWAVDGITHGMLIAEARLATPYVYAFHFYHHVTSPYIQELRQDFLQEFDAARPDFVVVAKPPRQWVIGSDTTRWFPGLDRRLEDQYVVKKEAPRYRLLERSDRIAGLPPGSDFASVSSSGD